MTPREIFNRAAKTFVQTAVPLVLAGASGVADINGAKALVLSACSAGLSAAWNSVSKFLEDTRV